MTEKSVLLFSGGVDSFVAYHYLGMPPTIYFDCKSRYSQKEIPVVLGLVPSTIIDNSLDLHDREYGEKAYIPFRNLLFALQAVKYADKIVIAGLADDKVSDKSKTAFAMFSDLMSDLEGREIEVVSPFWEMTKADVVEWYLKSGFSVEALFRTVSCYDPRPDVKYCGTCPSCFRKWVAFRANGLSLDFDNQELMQRYLADAKAGKYIEDRNRNIIRVVEEYLHGNRS